MSLSPILVLALDILGISLAVLDFTGAARKAEERLRKVSLKQRKRAKLYRIWGMDFTDRRYLISDFVRFSIQIPAMTLIALLIIYLMGWWPGLMTLQKFVPDMPTDSIWFWLVLLPLAPILWFGLYVLNRIVGTFMAIVPLVIFYRVFWLLSLPKAGILGSLGLLLPITTATLNTLNLT